MNRVSTGSDNALALNRRQAIIWNNAGLLSIGHLRTHFNEMYQNKQLLIHENASENIVSEMAAIFSRGRGGDEFK